jgi:hypothetical protein
MHGGFWWGNLRAQDHMRDLDINGMLILKWILQTWDELTWRDFVWLRIGANGGLL